MSSALSDYRPSTVRSVNIVGEFSEELAISSIPQILRLRDESNEPISVFIHSRGGFVDVLEAIDAALRTVDLDGNPSRVITVAVGDVSSAAANLFVMGNYAIAYPESRILFHGIRVGEVQVTSERAQNMVAELTWLNRRIARRVAEAIWPRVMFRFFQIRRKMQKGMKPHLSPMDTLKAFHSYLDSRTGANANKLLNRTHRRVCTAFELTEKVFSKVTLQTTTAPKNADARVLRALLRHELTNQKGENWRLDEAGMSALVDDYLLLREFSLAQGHSTFGEALTLYGPEFLEKKDLEAYQELRKSSEKPDQTKANLLLIDKTYHHVALLWFYAISLSHNLFVGENPISARDAYWLGIIDEVKGVKLQCERLVAEEKESKTTASGPTA